MASGKGEEDSTPGPLCPSIFVFFAFVRVASSERLLDVVGHSLHPAAVSLSKICSNQRLKPARSRGAKAAACRQLYL